jgi:hypothetical protein
MTIRRHDLFEADEGSYSEQHEAEQKSGERAARHHYQIHCGRRVPAEFT